MAIKELNNGNTVYGDTKDGYLKTRKKAKGIFEISVFTSEEKQVETMNGTLQNVLKTFNSKPFKTGLYLK